jgi:hypothetical protein
MSHQLESPAENTAYHGEVWTDGRGYATVTLPSAAPPPPVEYALRPLGGEISVRVAVELREGRFTIATDHPHVKVAWRISPRTEGPQ